LAASARWHDSLLKGFDDISPAMPPSRISHAGCRPGMLEKRMEYARWQGVFKNFKTL
jgi:hypothetical protein